MDDLLKDAIADAKAVRETALANAKIALEEAFTPRIALQKVVRGGDVNSREPDEYFNFFRDFNDKSFGVRKGKEHWDPVVGFRCVMEK